MHRRQLIAAAAGAILLPAGVARANQSEPVDATPAPVPRHHGRPRPIVLGDGIELVDYRIYPSEDVPRIIGEISSTRDEMVDSPVVSITFPELGEAGLAYAPPVLPVMRPGRSNMIFGILPQEVTSDIQLESAEFGLCSNVEAGPLTDIHQPLQLRIEIVEEERSETVLQIQGVFHNDGKSTIPWSRIQGLVRDSNGRYAGVSRELEMWYLAPDQPKEFTLWMSSTHPVIANPFLLLDGSTLYSTELFPGAVGFITQPGCPSLFGLD